MWALRDVSFDVQAGDRVGIIGRNGAGKSTLLKVLTRITHPTEGRAELIGSVGSLLEVGTGFHPELTGRENIYMNGAIIGMRRAEVREKFDEIVAFSEIGKYLDTPVKRYSSGMYVRLAFAVAAHLEPDILIVDEVLAVGDIEFQKKCLGRMGDVASEGRTVLFVSHNMGAISTLCSRAVLLDAGRVVASGPTSDVVGEYITRGLDVSGSVLWSDPDEAPGGEQVKLHAVRVVQRGESTADVDIDEEVQIEIWFWNFEAGQSALGRGAPARQVWSHGVRGQQLPVGGAGRRRLVVPAAPGRAVSRRLHGARELPQRRHVSCQRLGAQGQLTPAGARRRGRVVHGARHRCDAPGVHRTLDRLDPAASAPGRRTGWRTELTAVTARR